MDSNFFFFFLKKRVYHRLQNSVLVTYYGFDLSVAKSCLLTIFNFLKISGNYLSNTDHFSPRTATPEKDKIVF